MSSQITKAYAQLFDAKRKVYLGSGAMLVLLKSNGQAATPRYSSLKEYAAGWYADRVKGQDGAIYVKLQIADTDGRLSPDALDAATPATHFAFGGSVFEIDPNKTFRPIVQPKVFEVQGYETRDAYP